MPEVMQAYLVEPGPFANDSPGGAAVRSSAADPASGTSRAPPDSAGAPVIDERSGCCVLEPTTGARRCSETSDQQCRGGFIRANIAWRH